MRTILTMEPDVERLVLQAMRRTGRSMTIVINEALRLGLGARRPRARMPRFTVEPHDFGFNPGIDTDRLNQLVDKLEAEEASRRLTR